MSTIFSILQELDQGLNILEFDCDDTNVLTILTDETLTCFISHVWRNPRTEAVRTDFYGHLATPLMQSKDIYLEYLCIST